jgi:hypothetical protein
MANNDHVMKIAPDQCVHYIIDKGRNMDVFRQQMRAFSKTGLCDGNDSVSALS